ncbi:uncharacterized protein EAE97_001733 [Botrytis byssoidea]|uniref:Uncharacterized protein n=1 Tax=Botrytis byssoidea TaxID=139641 RepID=A0A9P5ISE7_9HELO|nr:uncharacterized protein EAE97_001733 [Botrytis byssoidea]KAF7952236.1 hypothetical protein EAE97_001733 [Botrytis byssoidea]
MTIGSVGGIFCTSWKGDLDALSLDMYLLLASLFQRRLMDLIHNSLILSVGYLKLLHVQEPLLHSEGGDPFQLLDHNGIISLDMEKRDSARGSSKLSEKKLLATKSVQIWVNVLSVLALAIKKQ